MFADRAEAGRSLGQLIVELGGRAAGGPLSAAALAAAPPVILGLPRGGVPVAYEVARALRAPLDVLVARKIGAPGNPELGIGAIAEGGVRVLNGEIMRSLLISQEELEHGTARAERELAERASLYRTQRPRIPLTGRTAIIVDDGLATGATARAAIGGARALGAAAVVLAVPVGAAATVQALGEQADQVICLTQPEPMWAIGMWYEDFSQIPDEHVQALLTRSEALSRDPPAGDGDGGGGGGGGGGKPSLDDPIGGADDPPSASEVEIPIEHGVATRGDLLRPDSPCCLVLFAHGSGSSRRSPRNRQVAGALAARGIATLLFDLLTPEEEMQRASIFDIALLASRLIDATRWARAQPQLDRLPIAYFGASTGGAAALWAAAELGGQIGAVVSRGGRPDLAYERLDSVRCPVLLIVGGEDSVVLDLNRQALAALRNCEASLQIVPGATHLFEEPGTLDEVARVAATWFAGHLAGVAETVEDAGQ